MEEDKKQKNYAAHIFIVSIILLIMAGGLFLYMTHKGPVPSTTSTTTSNSTTTVIQSTVLPQNVSNETNSTMPQPNATDVYIGRYLMNFSLDPKLFTYLQYYPTTGQYAFTKWVFQNISLLHLNSFNYSSLNQSIPYMEYIGVRWLNSSTVINATTRNFSKNNGIVDNNLMYISTNSTASYSVANISGIKAYFQIFTDPSIAALRRTGIRYNGTTPNIALHASSFIYDGFIVEIGIWANPKYNSTSELKNYTKTAIMDMERTAPV
jgi:hypothetical protein